MPVHFEIYPEDHTILAVYEGDVSLEEHLGLMTLVAERSEERV